MAAGHDASQGGGRGRGSKRSGRMRGFLLRAVITALGLWLASAWVSGVWIHGPGTLILAALLLGVVNVVVRPIAFVLTLPLTLLTTWAVSPRAECGDGRPSRGDPAGLSSR